MTKEVGKKCPSQKRGKKFWGLVLWKDLKPLGEKGRARKVGAYRNEEKAGLGEGQAERNGNRLLPSAELRRWTKRRVPVMKKSALPGHNRDALMWRAEKLTDQQHGYKKTKESKITRQVKRKGTAFREEAQHRTSFQGRAKREV